MKKLLTLLMVLFLQFSVFQMNVSVKASPETIIVPDDYPTIQTAVYVASDGDTVLVRPGVYNESLVVNKRISLIGLERNTTIIDCMGGALRIVENGVRVSNFTIQNGTYTPTSWYSVTMSSNDSVLEGNILKQVPRTEMFGPGAGSIGITGHRNVIRGNVLEGGAGVSIVHVQAPSNDNVIVNNDIHGGTIKIWPTHRSRGNRILDNRFFGQEHVAIIIYNTDHNTISNNTINSRNALTFIDIFDADYNTIVNNKIRNNQFTGWANQKTGVINIVWADHNIVQNNIISNNNRTKYQTIRAVHLWGSHDSLVTDNMIIGNDFLAVDVNGQTYINTDCVITNNTFSHNSEGLSIFASDNVRVFHNNFLDNTLQASSDERTYSWDDGREGNYWSDYKGWDNDGDGIGDVPYVINAYNGDNYPLMNPYKLPAPRIVSATLDKTDIDYGDWVTITVEARNDGEKADEMYISVSLPDNPPIDNIQMVSHDLQDAYILPVGDEVWGDYGTTYPIVLEYPLVEGFKEYWETEESKILQFKVKPQNTGTFRFFVKTTAQVNGEWSYDPRSGTKDQQNEYVYVYTVSVDTHRPDPPSQPSGPTSITIPLSESQTELASFSTSAIDPDGDQISIVFDWGDGTTTSTDFFDSGSTIEARHAWSFNDVALQGSLFLVKARAVDSHGAISEWSEPLAVSVNIASTSEVWTGYHGSLISSNSFTAISGKWNVPTVTGWGESGTWIGIGGVGDTPLLQVGTSVISLGPVSIYTAFFENWPENAITIDPINYPVYAGDTMEATIVHVSGNKWTLALRNLTPHGTRSPWTWSHTEVWRHPPDQLYANWIHEVKVGLMHSITPFTPITFSEASATIDGEDYLLGELPNTRLFRDLVYDASTQYTDVSALSDYNRFTIEYVADHAEESVAFFQLSSAANLSLYDSEGRHIGYNQTTGNVDLEIPGALWFVNQTDQYLALLNPNGNFTISLIGTEDGEYHLHYIVFSKGSIVQDQWLNGTISPNQKLEFSLEITALPDGTIESSTITPSDYPIDYRLYTVLAVASILIIVIASTIVVYRRKRTRNRSVLVTN